MPLNNEFGTDEYGSAQCPVNHVAWVWGEDDRCYKENRVCGEEVHLTVTSSGHLTAGDTVVMNDVGTWAIGHHWRVECLAGHVLAVSDGEESAEDFAWGAVFP